MLKLLMDLDTSQQKWSSPSLNLGSLSPETGDDILTWLYFDRFVPRHLRGNPSGADNSKTNRQASSEVQWQRDEIRRSFKLMLDTYMAALELEIEGLQEDCRTHIYFTADQLEGLGDWEGMFGAFGMVQQLAVTVNRWDWPEVTELRPPRDSLHSTIRPHKTMQDNVRDDKWLRKLVQDYQRRASATRALASGYQEAEERLGDNASAALGVNGMSSPHRQDDEPLEEESPRRTSRVGTDGSYSPRNIGNISRTGRRVRATSSFTEIPESDHEDEGRDQRGIGGREDHESPEETEEEQPKDQEASVDPRGGNDTTNKRKGK